MTTSPHRDIIAWTERLAEDGPSLLSRTLFRGGTFADLFYEHTVHHRCTLRQTAHPSKIEPPRQTTNQSTVRGLGIRVLGDDQIGYATTEDLSSNSLKATSEAAAAQCSGHPSTQLSTSLHPPLSHLEVPADAPDGVSSSEKSEGLRTAAEAALALDSHVRRVVVRYHDRVRRTVVATSEGMLVARASVLLGLRVEVTLRIDGRDVTAYAITGGTNGTGSFLEHAPTAVAREAAGRARTLADAQPLPSGPQPVVLAGGWGGVWLHEAVGHLLEADRMADGTSPFADKLGDTVAPPHVTLIDDATLPHQRGSMPYDDEGTPTNCTVLIENGRLAHVLTDRWHAAHLDLPLTGNARRQDYRHAPLPRMTNLRLSAGETAPEDLIAEVNDGLYVHTIGHGTVHPHTGVFSFDVREGYRIERGTCTAPVTGIRLRGSCAEALTQIIGIAHDVHADDGRGLCKKNGQVVPVSVGMPTVLICEMEVIGSEGTTPADPG